MSYGNSCDHTCDLGIALRRKLLIAVLLLVNTAVNWFRVGVVCWLYSSLSAFCAVVAVFFGLLDNLTLRKSLITVHIIIQSAVRERGNHPVTVQFEGDYPFKQSKVQHSDIRRARLLNYQAPL